MLSRRLLFVVANPSRCFALRQPSIRIHRHGFATEVISSLGNAYLDLALALPVPPTWPAYSTTIIVVTVASRLFITLPVSIWAKQRQWRAEEYALPIFRAYSRQLKVESSKKLAIFHPAVPSSVTNVQKEKLSNMRNYLFKKYNCSPFPTMIVPTLVQLPLFVLMSLVFQSVCTPVSPLSGEQFITLSSLIRPDSTAAFPIVAGLISLANVDTARWLVGGEHARDLLAREALEEKQNEAKGIIKIKPQMITKNILRVLSVLRIVIGMAMPGAVIIYWTTSSALGLIQSWVFDYWEDKRWDAGRGREIARKLDWRLQSRGLNPVGLSTKTASKPRALYWQNKPQRELR